MSAGNLSHRIPENEILCLAFSQLTRRNLEDDLVELLLTLLPVSIEHNLTELREVDEAVPGARGVAEVQDLLLHGVQTEAL